FFFFFSSRRRHTRSLRDWSSDVCSSDLSIVQAPQEWQLEIEQRLVQPLSHRPAPDRHGGEELADGRVGGQPPALSAAQDHDLARSEERRVGKECRWRWSPERGKKKNEKI